MILTESNKPLRMIGIKQSSMTVDAAYAVTREFSGDFAVIEPDEFLALADRTQYQYMVMFTLDEKLRKEIIDIIENDQLECFTAIHDSVIVCGNPREMVGHGTFICAFSSVLINSKVGKHCIIELYCLISHYSEVGDNVIMSPGVMIAGRTKIGSDCLFNFKSSVLNSLTICDGVEIGALSHVTKDITKPGRYIGSVARYAGERIPFDAI